MTLIPAAETGRAEKPPLAELGAPGTQFFSGFITTDEYVPELQGRRALDTFDRMRRSDGMTAGSLRAVKQPVLSAKWEIEPASSDARDREVADRLAWNLFEGMSMTFEEHLRQALTFLDFGFYVCEKVWDISDAPAPSTVLDFVAAQALPDGQKPAPAPRTFYMWSGKFAAQPMAILRKLAPRLQRTIWRWNVADDGGLLSVTQQIFGGQSIRTVDIPVGKLLVFVNDKEGANWLGRSLLRPAYKHWFINDQLYRMLAIQAERHSVGIPVMKLPENEEDTTKIQRAEDICMQVRAHERGYVVELYGWEFRIEGGGGDSGKVLDLLPAILHNDRRIALSTITQFLSLGDKAEGSNALSQDQSGFFMMVERALAQQIAEIHNRYLFPQWVAFNYGASVRIPKLRVGAIETRDAEKLINALALAAGAKLITPDARLEDALRALADMPLRDENTAPVKLVTEPTPAPGLKTGAAA